MRIENIPWSPAVICRPETSVAEAARLMDTHDVEGVIIVQAANMLVGCFGRDHLQSGHLPFGVSRRHLPIGPYATTCTFALTPETSVHQALPIMRRHALSMVPVARDGHILAIVSRSQLEALSERREHPPLRMVEIVPVTGQPTGDTRADSRDRQEQLQPA
jgi:CBS domain-containing protein